MAASQIIPIKAKSIIIFVNIRMKLGQDDPEWILVLMANVCGLHPDEAVSERIYCKKDGNEDDLGNNGRSWHPFL